MSATSGRTPTTAVEDERDRMSARIFELENRLRETEEELEYYFDCYRKEKKEQGAASGSSEQKLRKAVVAVSAAGDNESASSDSEDDDSAPGKEDDAESWSKTLGRNATVEYTRDSPMFRKRLWAFQETLKPLGGHTVRVLDRAEEYCKAAEEFQRRGVALAEELSSKEASRLMFSKNHSSTGDLAANMSAFGASFKQMHDLLTLFVDSIRSGLAGPLKVFKEGFRDHDDLADELDTRGREYEIRLSRALDQKELPKQGPLHDRAARSRWDFELYRFDLVRYVNQLDSKKVLLLEAGINNAFYALLGFFQGGLQILKGREKGMRRRQVLLDGMNRRYDADNALWAYVRSRLEAELQGALPPPGAPPGARAPINPRACCPVYAAELTTEILSAESQEASTADMAHCRDEGMLKQGYLFKRHVLGKERCWYRLHASKLYTLQLSRAARGDLPTCVFDLSKGATVAKRPGKVPFCFLLVGDDGYRLELQAETEDDMLNNLRSLELDRWSVFVLESLLEDMGNDVARQIWECNVSTGWTKPSSDTGPHDREHWIIAKYRWFGFVSEDRRDVATISKALYNAAARGDAQRIAWCIAHKGDVDRPDPDSEGGTPLHAACQADRRRAVVALLLNGASMYAKDDHGVTPQDIVMQDPHSDIALLLAEKETGDLW